MIFESLGQTVRMAGFIVPAGLGIQEGALTLIGAALGVSPAACLSLSVGKRLRECLVGGPALLGWFLKGGKSLRPAIFSKLPFIALKLATGGGLINMNAIMSERLKSSGSTSRTVVLVANGDLRLSANQKCWQEQKKMERALTAALRQEGWKVLRAHAYDPMKRHGFIDSQKMGLEVLEGWIPSSSHRCRIGLAIQPTFASRPLNSPRTHPDRRQLECTWPGLVGMLNLNGSLTKMGVSYSTIWSEQFKDDFFRQGLRQWLKEGTIMHDQSHVRPLGFVAFPSRKRPWDRVLPNACNVKRPSWECLMRAAWGCIMPLFLMNFSIQPASFKERLSQSALYAESREVSDSEAEAVYAWLCKKGVKFVFGEREEKDLTLSQVLWQWKMYIASLRLADAFGCATIGIQYQQV